MQRNKNRQRGSDPAFPRLLGERACLDYVNTIEGPLSAHPAEFLSSYHDLVRWVRHADLLDEQSADALLHDASQRPEQASAVFERASALRAALTRVFRAIAHSETPMSADLGALQEEYLAALSSAQLAPMAGRYGWVWRADGPALDQPLWPIIRSAIALLHDGDLIRIKQCPGADDCGWLFYDTSRNGARRWCSMEGCGSRVKMRQHYARSRLTVALSQDAGQDPPHASAGEKSEQA